MNRMKITIRGSLVFIALLFVLGQLARADFNSLLDEVEHYWLFDDDAPNPTVSDVKGTADGTLQNGDTDDIDATGPNDWLVGALEFDQTPNHFISTNPVTISDADTFTLAFWGKRSGTSDSDMVTGNTPGSGNTSTTGFDSGTMPDRAYIKVANSSVAESPELELSTTDWHEYAWIRDSDDLVDLYVDGSLAESDVYSGAESGTFRFTRIAKNHGAQANVFDGLLSGMAYWDRDLSAAEIAEWHAGPEPVMDVAPTVTGTPVVGQILTTSDGDWDLPSPFVGESNGTISYRYQWQRNTGGGGWTDIPHTNSQTYKLTASDAGNMVRSEVIAINDGGESESEVSDNEITVDPIFNSLLDQATAHWPMQDDEANTTVVDASGGGNHGTLQGGDDTEDLSAAGPNSWYPKALEFTDSGDRVIVTTISNSSGTPATFATWVNIDSFGGSSYVVQDGSLHIDIDNSGDGVVNSSTFSASLSTDTWYSAIATKNGSNLWRWYTNGVESASGGVSAGSGMSVLLLHGATASFARRFAGTIVFNGYQFTDSDVAQWYAGPEPVNVAAPVIVGTPVDGEVLFCPTGNWDLPSPFGGLENGTITFTYQWQRDTGGGFMDIVGETTNAYTAAATDAGNEIRCLVTGRNIGGIGETAASNSVGISFAARGGAMDVVRDLGLVPNSEAAASTNSQKLNAAMRSSARPYTFYFPGGAYYFGEDTVTSGIDGTCIQVPRMSGFKFSGGGLVRNGNDKPGVSVHFAPTAVRIIYAGPRITFDGDNWTGTASGMDAVVTIGGATGYTVKDQDVGGTLEITGGDHFTAGRFYRITDVDAGANTWTLDRNPTDGSAASGMLGLFSYRLWHERGYGNTYEGLAFRGNATDGGTRAHVGIHVTGQEETGGLNTGKHALRDCYWTDWTAGVLTGETMERAYQQSVTFFGEDVNQADNLLFEHCRTRNVRTFLYMRNEQSVGHELRHIRLVDTDSAVYAERGGQVYVDGLESNGTPEGVLRIGDSSSNNGHFVFRNINFDGQTPSGQLKHLTMDQTGQLDCLVEFRGVYVDDMISSGSYDASRPLYDVKGATKLIIDSQKRLRVDSLNGTSHDNDLYPSIVVTNSMLEGLTRQSDLIDSTTSHDGMIIHFAGNSDMEGDVMYATETFVVGDLGKELMIASNAINLVAGRSYHTINTAGGADNLVTINGGVARQVYYLQAADDDNTIVLKDGTGNLQLGGDRSLDSTADQITLFYDGSTFYEQSFSDNGS